MYLGAAEVRAQRVSQAHNDGTENKVKRSDFGLTWKDMPKATWQVRLEKYNGGEGVFG